MATFLQTQVAQRTIAVVRAGAHLYGTATPASDVDTKCIFVPAGRDILLQQVPPTRLTRRGGPSGERSRSGEEEVEAFSLQRYLTLLTAGQPLAVELLFAPDSAMVTRPDALWREVQAIGPSLLSRQAGMFLRYCRQQAEIYEVKGERAAAAREAAALLALQQARHGRGARLAEIAAALTALAAASPHVTLCDIEVQDGRWVRHLDVCGRKTPFTATIGTAREAVERIAVQYGARSLKANQQGGADWKALSHAVRIGREAVELFTTGRLSFPLRCAPRLLAIKLGGVAYADVVDEITALLEEVEHAVKTSALPLLPDHAAAEALVIRAYGAQVSGLLR